MEFNLADLMEANADAFPDRLAVVSGDTRLSYGQLDERATRLANHWRAQGIKAGDSIGLYLYNCHEYVECMYAAWKLRACTINVNYRYVEEELRYIFDNADLVGVIHEEELSNIVDGALTPGIHLRMTPGPDYEAALAEASPERDFPARSADDLVIIYTGGTTGMPRGVMWRHEDLFFAALQGGNPGGVPFREAAALAPQMKENGDGLHILPAAPLIHGNAQLANWIALLNGGVVALVPGKSFLPEASLDLCAAEAVHSLSIVGDAMALPLIQALEENPGRWDLRDLSVIASAGAILSANLLEKLETLIPSVMVLNSFGASETGHQGTAFYDDGKPTWFMDEEHTIVLDENLDRVQPGSGTVGMLARFGHIPLGYYKDEEKTAATFKEKDGVRYVIPGDMATVDAEENVVFLGRGSVCINTGGEKVYPEEVEEALKHHDAVLDAIVVGVPDDRWGQRVEALVTVRDNDNAHTTSMEAFCRTRLAGYKVPRAIWVVDDLNRQPSGKPDYRWARDKAMELGEQP
jgi:acyl-CoA synthetase (AMP-forming)/AMP-acid ligase II